MADWVGIALIHYRGDPLTDPVDLGEGVAIGPVPPFVKTDAHLEETLSFYQKNVVSDSRAALLKHYETDCLGEAQQWVDTSITAANLALWLAKPSIAGFEFLVHYEKSQTGNWHHRSYGNHPALNPHKKAVTNRLDSHDFELAKTLNESIHGLPRPGSVWTAVRLLLKSLTESADGDVRFLHLWVALDALFGADREIRYMISHRIAFFLGSDVQKARDLCEQVQAGYGLRNIFAHCGQPTKKQRKDDMDQRGWESEEILRRALNKILLSGDLVQSFSGRGREEYLNDLVFSFAR